jgi:hypothetical protein
MAKTTKSESSEKFDENAGQVVEPVATVKEQVVTKFPTETIINSKRFKGVYQQDFMRVLLPKEEYSIEEAETILKNYFNEGGK